MNKTVYEFLPTLYALAGVIVGLAFDSTLGRYAAALLVLASIFIFNLRLNHRSQKQQEQAAPQTRPDLAKAPS